jgi:hypothetical protein
MQLCFALFGLILRQVNRPGDRSNPPGPKDLA